ncbi:MAG TPA: protein kinase, partial [Vicinamibacterales bacterium]|nr:protein kinase [Vicinamibacterales bacterium]
MTLAPGMKLGPYEILGPLGAGGMGEVYRARDARLDRDVALKVLPQAVAGDADRLMRFEREAKALAAVNHPNIAQVFGLEEGPSSSRAIVMELIHGDDLSAIIARGPMAVADAIAIARQIAEALEAAHDHGIIHRDLKPGNIKVRTDGTVKVLDFGLAKAAENASTAGGSLAPTITSPAMTHAGVVLGTAAYMSPEQAKGKVVDRRTDIWSFGAVFYEMLTATRAFPGDDVTDTIVSIVSKEPDWSRLPANTPLAVPTLLRRCVIKDPRRRLRDIGEARLVLDDVQSGRVEPAPEMTAVPIWRRMVPIATTVLVMATLGYAAWQLMPIRQNQVVRFSMTLPEDFEFTRSSSRMIDVSRDGSQIVYLGDGQLYLRSLASGATRVLRGTVGVDPATPFFSPDGEWVAFYSVTDGAVKKIAVSGGTSMTICPLGMGVPQFQGGAWEGNTIYFAQHGKGILAVPADGGEPTVVAAVEPNQSVFGPAFLPGGRTLLMAVTGESAAGRWDRADIVAYTPATGDRKVVLRGGGAPRYLPGGYLVYATGSNLVAVPFDTAALEVRGSPVAVVENVRRVFDAASGAAQFAISDEGTLAYIPGNAINPRLSLLAIARLDGSLTVEPLPVAAARYTTPRLSPDGRHIAVTVADEVSSSIWVGELGSKLLLRR